MGLDIKEEKLKKNRYTEVMLHYNILDTLQNKKQLEGRTSKTFQIKDGH